MNTRTRFAPSPTGYIHVGNVRSALFPYLIARQTDGQFVLRIEDTDRARFVPGAEDLILDALEWLGIDWDEGPRKGGDKGPYHQSERLAIYHRWAQKLISKGLAYADPYTPEEVQSFREQAKAAKKAFLYRDYRPENPPEWDGTKPLRFKVSHPKRYTWDDAVMGELSAGPEALDDFILIKADGYPTYNFAHIVDDAEMGITHVIRGIEYISSTPRYLSLYEALDITPPVLACLPHIMAPDGKKKLGKRDGAKSVTDYRTDGILPEAMLNFLASMGWNDGTEQEIFTKDELIEKFSLDRVQKSGARFDEKRLLWMNGYWIRSLDLDDLYRRVANYWPAEAAAYEDVYKKQVLTLAQDRLKTLAELSMMTRYFFAEPVRNDELITSNKQLKKLDETEIRELLTAAIDQFEAMDAWTPETIQETLNQLLETTGQKPGILFSLIRIAVTWAPFSPQLNDTLALLGRDRAVTRLKNF
ncbi:MAG TPA: glutamate--tRNA ligase [Candidatus Nanoperiomorbaceae bacterium]|nr:glutamate--tRNA ligase [Candidatus Nanoperiomorbaceae bacterium]HMQ96551.1 glutamate--tRNA ligase [Candidatus Nanoperiomorbaceae bacterium]HMR86353.1 glutamate--tRNA ligase [Candidatus Nanoperiomorbaceae bacterium]HMU11952.1 glutamate--tRNA ligase [Candidatus Nanoperiomorbaceae bacterium]